jgi:hypothetical protein
MISLYLLAETKVLHESYLSTMFLIENVSRAEVSIGGFQVSIGPDRRLETSPSERRDLTERISAIGSRLIFIHAAVR